MQPVKPLTFKGRFLCFLIKLLLTPIGWLYGKKWQYPLLNFEENPRYFTPYHILFFAWKYYIRAIEKQEVGANPFQAIYFQKSEHLANESTEISLSTGGDLMPYQWLNAKSGQKLWQNTGDWFFGADLVFANLETPIDTRFKENVVPEVMLNNMRFNGSNQLFQLFSGYPQFKGYDVLSVANNHSLDMGEDGLLQTIRFLSDHKVLAVGAFTNPEDANTPKIIEKQGIKIAFIAATYCLNDLPEPKEKWRLNVERFQLPDADITNIANQCLQARQQGADLVVLSLHTGNAYQAYPSEHTRTMMQRLCNVAMPDLILGSHPHNAQPIEKLSNQNQSHHTWVVYSQGDFVAYDIFTWCHLHLALKWKITKYTLANGQKSTIITGLEVYPMTLLFQNDENEKSFRFEHLLEVSESAYPHQKNEINELKRLWNIALAQNLGHLVYHTTTSTL